MSLEFFLHLNQYGFVFVTEAVENAGINGDFHRMGPFAVFTQGGGEAALNFDADGEGGFNASASGAVVALDVGGCIDAFFKPLAGHLKQTELGDGKYVGARPVAFQGIPEGFINRILVAFASHINEVDNDESADIAQAQLAGDFGSGFGVDGEN